MPVNTKYKKIFEVLFRFLKITQWKRSNKETNGETRNKMYHLRIDSIALCYWHHSQNIRLLLYLAYHKQTNAKNRDIFLSKAFSVETRVTKTEV